MALSKKEKKALDKMWGGASEASGSNIDAEDGNYQFKILKAVFKVSTAGKPGVNLAYKIVGGDKEFHGVKGNFRENLESQDNMSWFKRRVKQLGLKIPKTFADITDGTLLEAMVGLVFDGQLKTSGDFQNVYVTKLVKKKKNKKDEEEEEEDDDEEESDDEDDDDSDDSDDSDSDDDDDDDDSDDEDSDDDDDSDDSDDDDDSDSDSDSDDDDSDDEDDGDSEELLWPADAGEVKGYTKAECKALLTELEIKPGADPKKTLASLCAVEHKKKLPGKETIRIAKALGMTVKGKDVDGKGMKKLSVKIRKAIAAKFE